MYPVVWYLSRFMFVHLYCDNINGDTSRPVASLNDEIVISPNKPVHLKVNALCSVSFMLSVLELGVFFKLVRWFGLTIQVPSLSCVLFRLIHYKIYVKQNYDIITGNKYYPSLICN